MKEPELKKIDINSIKIDLDNPNKMSEETFEALKKAIQKYGYIVPIIVDKDLKIADGEHRYLAYKELDMKEIPAYILDISDPDRRILRQVMNKLKGEHNYMADLEEFKKLNALNKLSDLKIVLPEFDMDILEQLTEIPNEKEYDEGISTEHECPKCGYQW